MAAAHLNEDAKVLAAIFVTAGVAHLVRPNTFAPIMPQFVPAQRGIVLVRAARAT